MRHFRVKAVAPDKWVIQEYARAWYGLKGWRNRFFQYNNYENMEQLVFSNPREAQEAWHKHCAEQRAIEDHVAQAPYYFNG